MATARVHLNGPKSAHPLLSNLEAAGIQVLAVVDDASRLAREVVRLAPDLVICDDPAR